MKKTHYSLLLVCLISAASLESCTAIGLVAGLVADGNSPSHDTVSIFPNSKYYYGQTAYIQRRANDATMSIATFDNYSDETLASYISRYNSYYDVHAESPAAFSFGDSIVVITNDRSKHRGRFEGYLPEGIQLNTETLSLRSRYEDEEIDTVRTLNFSRRLTKSQLALLYQSNALPVRAILNFSTQNARFSLTNNDFHNIKIMPYTATKWLGGLLKGMAADAAVVSDWPH